MPQQSLDLNQPLLFIAIIRTYLLKRFILVLCSFCLVDHQFLFIESHILITLFLVEKDVVKFLNAPDEPRIEQILQLYVFLWGFFFFLLHLTSNKVKYNINRICYYFVLLYHSLLNLYNLNLGCLRRLLRYHIRWGLLCLLNLLVQQSSEVLQNLGWGLKLLVEIHAEHPAVDLPNIVNILQQFQIALQSDQLIILLPHKRGNGYTIVNIEPIGIQSIINQNNLTEIFIQNPQIFYIRIGNSMQITVTSVQSMLDVFLFRIQLL